MSEELREISYEDFDILLGLHALWLESHGKEGKRANLSGMDLQFKDFDKRSLALAICKGADFNGANLNFTSFRFANLKKAAFGLGAQLGSTDFRDAVMDETTDFTGADLLYAIVDPKDFKKVNLLVVDKDKLPTSLYALRERQEKARAENPGTDTNSQWMKKAWDALINDRAGKGRKGLGADRFKLGKGGWDLN